MRIFSTLFPVLLSMLISAPVSATSVLPASLEHLSKAAELIFHGKVIANEVKKDDISGRVATYTTFEVIERVKGDSGRQHTIKQLGGQMPGSDRVQKIHGAPRFTAGEEYVVFLPRASSLGFSSPLGLSQGSFLVRDLDGTASVSNGRKIQGLLPGRTEKLKALPQNPSSASLVEFLRTVSELASE